MNREIYLDCAASSPVTNVLLKQLVEIYQKKLGNSSSIHHAGVHSNIELEKARINIAKKINANPDEIYFTSGATESNNLALIGILRSNTNIEKNEIITSPIEHSSVTNVLEQTKKMGYVLKLAPVNKNGEIIYDELKKLINKNTFCISIIHANNEIGVIQDLVSIGELCKINDIIFHSDGAQGFCKSPIDVQKMNLSLYSISGHKIHAPKGIGALFVKKNIPLSPIYLGGSQESGLRPGTVPVELASLLAKATELFDENALNELRFKYNVLYNTIKSKFSNIQINGESNYKLPNIINFSISGHDGKKVMRELDKRGIRISVGSACNSGKKVPSQVLTAIQLTPENALQSIRVSWGLETTIEEIEYFINQLSEIISIGEK